MRHRATGRASSQLAARSDIDFRLYTSCSKCLLYRPEHRRQVSCLPGSRIGEPKDMLDLAGWQAGCVKAGIKAG